MDPGDLCDFETTYVCGYHNQGSSLQWKRIKAIRVTNELGPSVDSSSSVLGTGIYIIHAFVLPFTCWSQFLTFLIRLGCYIILHVHLPRARWRHSKGNLRHHSPFVEGILRLLLNSPHREPVMQSPFFRWTNCNKNRIIGYLRCGGKHVASLPCVF